MKIFWYKDKSQEKNPAKSSGVGRNNEIGYICEDCEMSLSMHFLDSLGSDDFQTSGEQTPSLLDTTFTFTVSVLF